MNFESPGYCTICNLWTMHKLHENENWHCTKHEDKPNDRLQSQATSRSQTSCARYS